MYVKLFLKYHGSVIYKHQLPAKTYVNKEL